MRRVAVVTGAGSRRGIGRATAARLLQLDWDVAVIDIAPDVEQRAEELDATGEHVLPLRCDVTVEAEVESTVARVVERFGRIDALANVAGVTAPGPVTELTETEWDRIFAINLKGAFFFTKHVAPHMQQDGFGRIVNLSSMSGERGGGNFGATHYTSAKAAILGFSRTVAGELGPHGVTCNSVAPGFVDTDITGGWLNEERQREFSRDIPMRRIGRSEDVAAAIAFLFSDDAEYVTGAVIDVNGGAFMH